MKNQNNFWEKYISAWENSGMSQAEYCRKYGISSNLSGIISADLLGTIEPQKAIPIPAS